VLFLTMEYVEGRHTLRDVIRDEAPLTPTNPEIRRSQVTLKTVFTISGGVLLVAAFVLALSHALLAITLTVTAALLAIAVDHVVAHLTRRRVPRSLAIAVVMLTVVGLQPGLG